MAPKLAIRAFWFSISYRRTRFCHDRGQHSTRTNSRLIVQLALRSDVVDWFDDSATLAESDGMGIRAARRAPAHPLAGRRS
jgi:hypothetical protein